jgi:4a-hydroxytetrahydrobiopterin dehydratase
MTLLEIPALKAALTDLPGVHRSGMGRLEVHLKAPTFADAVTLVTDVAAVAEELDHHPDVDLRYRDVSFRLATHSAGGVTELDLDLARRILTLAGELGAEVLPPVDRVEVAIDTLDAAAVRPFWKAVLAYREQGTDEGGVELQDPDGEGPIVWFQPMDPDRPGRGRIHLDVYVHGGREAGERRVADALAAGGRLVSDEFVDQGWWVLADAEGNEACVCLD